MITCPSCGKGTINSKINNSPYMIIKEEVTENEKELGLFCLSGHNKYGRSEHTTSYYLQKEMGAVGLNLTSFSLSALYLHDLPTRKRTKEEKAVLQKCIDFSISELVKIVENKKIVVLMGAELVRTFTGYGVSETSGLVTKSDKLPDVPVVIPAPNCDKIFQMPVGELRFALKTIAREVKIYEEYRKV